MIGATAKLRWSQNHPAREVSANQLARVLDSVAAKCEEVEGPFIVDMTVHGYEMTLGLGLPESFVHFKSESGRPPYFITVGDQTAKGVVAFYLHGTHATEIPRRNLISTPEAVDVAREFLERGERSASVEWEEV